MFHDGSDYSWSYTLPLRRRQLKRERAFHVAFVYFATVALVKKRNKFNTPLALTLTPCYVCVAFYRKRHEKATEKDGSKGTREAWPDAAIHPRSSRNA
jgi:hypothetical protein